MSHRPVNRGRMSPRRYGRLVRLTRRDFDIRSCQVRRSGSNTAAIYPRPSAPSESAAATNRINDSPQLICRAAAVDSSSSCHACIPKVRPRVQHALKYPNAMLSKYKMKSGFPDVIASPPTARTGTNDAKYKTVNTAITS